MLLPGTHRFKLAGSHPVLDFLNTMGGHRLTEPREGGVRSVSSSWAQAGVSMLNAASPTTPRRLPGLVQRGDRASRSP